MNIQRELPPGLSARDAAILRSVKKRAHYLDKGFRICGIRFGWTFIIGLIPLVGDATDAGLNYFLVVRKARKADLPDWLLHRMLINNAVSAGVGFVPVVGDVILAIYKANSRNAALLEEFLRIRGEEFLKMGGVVEDPQTKKGVMGLLKSGKAKSAVPASDVEQVKPGSGMTAGEVKQVINAPVAKNSNAVASTSTSAGLAPTTATKTKKSSSGSGSSGFSFFGSRSKKSSPVPAPTNDKGRFVENVDAPSAFK